MPDRTLYELPDDLWHSESGEVYANLRDLVKVEPCPHGNYAPHILPFVGRLTWSKAPQCDGKPEADDGVHWGNTSGKPEADHE